MISIFDYTLIPQQPDSLKTHAVSSFQDQNSAGFMGQQTSILSTTFSNKSLDSIVKAKTRRLRPAKKKEIPAYRCFESNLIIKKDSFLVLNHHQSADFKSLDLQAFLRTSETLQAIEPNHTFHSTNDTVFLFKDSLRVGSPHLAQQSDSILQANDTLLKASDSITQKNKIDKAVHITEIKSSKAIQKETTASGSSTFSSETWLMGLLLAILFLFALIKLQFSSKLSMHFQSIFSFQYFSKLFKEQNTLNLRLGQLLSVIFYLNTSLIFLYSTAYFHPDFIINSEFKSFLFILLSLLVLFASYSILNKLLAFVFETYELIKEHLYNLYFTHRIIGLILLPFVVLYPYVPQQLAFIFLIFAWLIILLSFISRWFRGLQISFKYRVPYFYLILYLCALEIIPLLFLLKMILSID